ncbi:MAG: hypothetical protein K2N56_04160 [Oscillospiraceae bacterium]|nr:hypothetical protein [Oscillospiraceae bacterium]
MNIEIFPLDKVLIDGVSVFLGADRSTVEAAIGAGELAGKRYYYYKGNMAVDYDSSDKVKFIEFLGGVDGELHPVIYGVPAFETTADKLTELLTEKNNGEIDDSEHGYSYGFLNISVGVYRTRIPDDIEDMIEDAEEDGEELDDEDIEFERRKADHWATIGIGVKDYYR